jgi:hypothetical protein
MNHDPSTPVLFDLEPMHINRSMPVPKMDFPKFNGKNPRLWRDQCVMYFEVYGIRPAMKTRYAALNFQGSAATWLQTVERRGRVTDWDHLCRLVFAQYDRDQYPNQLKQLENLKQTGTVAEYYAQFEKLVHGILLYNPAYDEVYFVTRFLVGLKDEIRTPITLHRPRHIATASALALLQEEELQASKPKSFGWVFIKATNKQSKSEQEDKLASLKQYRRKNSLCFKCGGKWAANQTCPD